MKGKISEKLEKVLADPSARRELRRSLVKSGGGVVTVGANRYKVTKRQANSGSYKQKS